MVAGGVIKRPSEPSQERNGVGVGQRGADVALAYSSPRGSLPPDLPIDLPPSTSFLILLVLVNGRTTGLHSGRSLALIGLIQCRGEVGDPLPLLGSPLADTRRLV